MPSFFLRKLKAFGWWVGFDLSDSRQLIIFYPVALARWRSLLILKKSWNGSVGRNFSLFQNIFANVSFFSLLISSPVNSLFKFLSMFCTGNSKGFQILQVLASVDFWNKSSWRFYAVLHLQHWSLQFVARKTFIIVTK